MMRAMSMSISASKSQVPPGTDPGAGAAAAGARVAVLDAERRRIATGIVTIGARLYAKGLIAAGDGNISARAGELVQDGDAASGLGLGLADASWWITASGTHKGFLDLDDVLEVDRSGAPRPGSAGARRPSSEWSLHAACYAERPDCGAVVHAHPPTAIALSLAGVSLEEPVLSEAALVLGSVPVAPYVTPTTAAVGETLRPFVRRANAVILAHHGALCLGRTLEEAWRRMETLEHTALVIWRARALGPVPALPHDEVARLRALAGRLGM
jgi:L-fuculose-phosphate aldolase